MPANDRQYLIKRNFLKRLAALCALPTSALLPTGARAQPALRAEYEAFASELAAKHNLDLLALRRLFAQIKAQPSIIRAMNAPSTSLPWHAFRKGHVDPVRISGGVKFWQQHAATLARAARDYGVPEEIICATIGIKINYFKPVVKGRVTCDSEVVNQGKNVAHLEATMRVDGVMVARASGDFAIFKPKATEVDMKKPPEGGFE